MCEYEYEARVLRLFQDVLDKDCTTTTTWKHLDENNKMNNNNSDKEEEHTERQKTKEKFERWPKYSHSNCLCLPLFLSLCLSFSLFLSLYVSSSFSLFPIHKPSLLDHSLSLLARLQFCFCCLHSRCFFLFFLHFLSLFCFFAEVF